MGKTVTPGYVVRVRCAAIHATDSCWRGRVTEKRLREYLEAYNASLEPGGANAQVGRIFGIERAKAVEATIYRNVLGGAALVHVVL